MLRLKKSVFIALFMLMALQAPLFAAGGLLSGQKNLQVYQTQWFDIIFPQNCEKSAGILAQAADQIFVDVAAEFGREPFMRLPVVITPATDQLNAFFTPSPYNRIVLFDTSSEVVDELSASYSQQLLSIFRHELTHAVSENVKNSFWTTVGKVFGDLLDPGYLFVASGMAEGAAVVSESMGGEGRLNNEFFRHTVKQAKLENKFPGYYDVQGASDVYPAGSFYDFNAAFHQWLLEKYGSEKYAAFWYKLINVQALGVTSAFKKAYGIKLKDAWKAFYDDYEVPQILENPVAQGAAYDFFDRTAQNYSAANLYGARYTSLSASEKGISWLEAASKSVYFLPIEHLQNPRHAKKIIEMSGLQTARLSCDGRFMALSYYSDKTANVTAEVKILDVETGRLFSSKLQGLKDASLVFTGTQYFLVGQRYSSPYNNIEIYELIFKDDKITGALLKTSVPQELFAFPGSFVQCDTERFAYIFIENLRYYICVADLQGNVISTFPLPQSGMYASQLSFADGNLIFNWTLPGTMPRLGVLSLADGTFTLSGQDISGGVFYPVSVSKENGTSEIIYVGQFFRENRLLVLADFPADSENAPSNPDSAQVAQQSQSQENAPLFAVEGSATPLPQPAPEFSLEPKKYNPFTYLRRGILLPYSSYTSEAFGLSSDAGLDISLPIGISYFTSAPWSYGTDSVYELSLGWGPLTNSFGISLSASEGTATSLFSYSGLYKAEFDTKGWKQGIANVGLNSSVPVGRRSYVSFSNTAYAKFGRQNYNITEEEYKQKLEDMYTGENLFSLIGMNAPQNDTVYARLLESFSVTYSNIHSAGPARFEYAGFGVGAGLSAVYASALEENPASQQKTIATTGVFVAYLPHILPFESQLGYTYNFPLSIRLSLFPSESTYGYANAPGDSTYLEVYGLPFIEAKTETVLFGMDVQKSLPFFTPLFIHDFYFILGYAGTFSARDYQAGFQPLYLGDYLSALKTGSSLYQDAVYLKCAIDVNPNIGVTARSALKMNLTILAKCSIRQLDHTAARFGGSLILGGSF